MKKARLIVLLLLMLCLAGLLALRIFLPETSVPVSVSAPSTPAELPESPFLTPQPTAVPTAEPTHEPTPEPTPTPTPEPTPAYFTISVIGDQTLASSQFFKDSPVGYAARMNGDFSYPFHNTVEYFKNDDLTISNLECTLTDKNLWSAQQFYFRSPTDYVNILIEGGVDFVTTANNHMLDFGQEGLDDTWAALDSYGFPYGKDDDSNIYTLPSGLVVGIYTAYNSYQPSIDRASEAIRTMRERGAEYIVCCYHWGQELYYQPTAFQVQLAHASIDAGADLIFGCHPHCLQPIEYYGSGIILYSMGNWSFGGNTAPSDKDTAIVQVTVKRDVDGTISNDDLTIIPCCVSSRPVKEGYSGDNYNDYVPTPYTVDSDAYNRVLSKLDGTYQATSQGRDYSDVYASWG